MELAIFIWIVSFLDSNVPTKLMALMFIIEMGRD